MNMIRTTVTFPEDLHQQLMVESIVSKKSLSAIIIEKLSGRSSAKATARTGRAFFNRIARMRNAFDTTRAVREERDRL